MALRNWLSKAEPEHNTSTEHSKGQGSNRDRDRDNNTSGADVDVNVCANWICNACTYCHSGDQASFLVCAVCMQPRNTRTSSGAAGELVVSTTKQGICASDLTSHSSPSSPKEVTSQSSGHTGKKRRISDSVGTKHKAVPFSTPFIDKSIHPLPSPKVPGLFLVYDFISPSEECKLLAELDSERPPQWKENSFNGVCFGMKWGVVTNLGARTVRPPSKEKGEVTMPLPPHILGKIASRIATIDFCKLAKVPARIDGKPVWVPNECNANDYYRARGHELTPHFDDRHLSGPFLATLSMSGACVMTFTRARDGHEVGVALPRRSLQLVTRDARYNWQHSIKNKDLHDDRRTSITFRMSKLTAP